MTKMLSAAELAELVTAQHAAVLENFRASGDKIGALGGRLNAVEQMLVQRPGPGGGFGGGVSWGAQVAQSQQLADFIKAGGQGRVRIPLQAATITSAPASGGVLVEPDRQSGIVPLPRPPLRIRALLAPGTTNSNMVEYVKAEAATPAADVVSEGAEKPQATLTWELAEAPVRTIAVWIPASRQILQDAPLLQGTIDNELRFMVGYAEEQEVLLGSGVSPHLLGLIPQATDFAAPFDLPGDETDLDRILQAIAQVEFASKLPVDGVVMNDLRWRRMQAIKDTQGRYLGAGPFVSGPNTVWGVPVVASPSIDEDHFLIGSFKMAAQIIDRMETTLFMSDSHEDFFIKNMIVLLMEERVALAVKRPDALVYGNFPTGTGT